MEIPTLVVSDPPHHDVDLGAAAAVLDLDIFVTRLKAKFRAPEVLSVSGTAEAADYAGALRATGFSVATISGAVLRALPWPDPVSTLAFDQTFLRATLQDESVEVDYKSEVVGVFCSPPNDFSLKAPIDLRQAVRSGHGPTIAAAIQGISSIDLYVRDSGRLRRLSIIPELIGTQGEEVAMRLHQRFERLKLDTRLVGVRPRARYIPGETVDPNLRKGCSFGTRRLREALDSISRELGEVPQFELGSRIGYALRPLAAAD